MVSRFREVALLPDTKDVEILRSGPRAWNAWRENNPSTVPNLTGIALSLSERQMGPINGGPINLKSARLQGAFLRFATLSAADLEAADMSAADLVHARFDQANLSAANLSDAQLDHADLSGATLTKVDLCGASLQHAILSTADLQAADMSGADLMHARLDRANLSGANLTDARLDYADFAGADLSQANLCGASLQHAKNLTESQLRESRGSGTTILPPHLQGSVSWSVAQSATEIERHDLGPRARLPAEVDVSPLGNPLTASIGRHSPPRTAFTPSGLGNQVASWGRFSLGIPASSGWWMRAMEGLLKREEGTRFIGTIERLAEGWRASFRLRVPSQVFTQRDTEVFNTELQATKWVHTQATARGFSSIEIRTRINSSSIHGVNSRVAALFIGVTLVISAFVWQHMNEAVPLDTSSTQRGSESFLTQPKSSLDTGTQGLQPSASEALMEEKAAERRPSADAEISPSVASTVDQTETTPEQRPAPETDRATPQETNVRAESQASHGAKPSAEALGSLEHAPGTPAQSDDSALVSAESPPAPSQHAIVPDLSAAAPIPDPQDPQAAGQPAETVAANTPDLSAPMSKAPDLPAEAATPALQDPQAAEQPAEALAVNTPWPSAPVSKAPDLPAEAASPELPDPQAAEQPAEALAVNTPEQHLDASPPNYTALPPVTTAPPSVDVTALPHDAEIVPKPVKKPGILAGKPVIQKPVTKPVIQKPVGKPVIQRADVDSKPAGRPRANGQNLGNKKTEPRPTGRSSTADLLAGGL